MFYENILLLISCNTPQNIAYAFDYVISII